MAAEGKTRQIMISVGTYSFIPLLQKMDTPEMIEVFKKHGFNKVIYQCGRSEYTVKNVQKLIDTEVFGLTPKFQEYVIGSELIIGHGGAGTILDTIKNNIPAIIVSNEGMVNNHQQELVDALVEENAIVGLRGSAEVSPESIDAAITKIKQKVVKPLQLPKDNNIFKMILDEGRYD